MLERRNVQGSFFHAQSLPHRVPKASFYGRMGAHSDVLFHDDDLAEMYCPDNGRPSLPPSLTSGVLLLQLHDLPIDYAGFDPSSLSVHRRRCLQYGEVRYAFDLFIQVGRAAGVLPDKATLLIESTPAKGASAVQHTHALLCIGIRKLL